ncbi:MAG TPA: bifunctional phosphopantothenoylcysteine decarboxylase/phosphopantothenate--cysteine ligase CoaBC [Solirubrobacteraceae bacterium]|jgi:phosphopantothenoylcysteine decarboxylase/phosphopantothenate--cysteine ligase|nr:bifunctional phosphopantothenoylcysteine decarboxylase/phosphopantothenate--cysteine ligase CoaBC [Solirubrobacteraceae bacterium]
MSRILLGVSGGIAAYKALELVRLATGAGHAVRVVQTPASRRFVGSASFAALTGAPVLVDEFERDPARGTFPDRSRETLASGEHPRFGQPLPEHEPIGHLELVRNADLYLIAPASANTIAKLAHGLADNLLTSAALAATCPLVVAPAMNNHMYEHPATQANLQTLRARGATVVEPDSGRLASKGEQGVGRLPDPARLLEVCEELLAREGSGADTWRGLRVLVTAGGTREPIDSVRFLGNGSSGRMGLALAHAARARGAEVTVIAANIALPPPEGVAWREVATAAQLAEACEREFPACDVLLMAAAVADFRPAEPANGKLKKAGRARLRLELEATPDVLSGLATRRRPGQTLVGFAAEHGADAVDYGQGKLHDKGLDAIVVNDISRPDIGIGADSNEVVILTAGGHQHVEKSAKANVAEAILDAVERLRADR